MSFDNLPPLFRAILNKEPWPQYELDNVPSVNLATGVLKWPRERKLHKPSKSTRCYGLPSRIIRSDFDDMQIQATSFLWEGLEDGYDQPEEGKLKNDESAFLDNEATVVYVLRRHVLYPVMHALNYVLLKIKNGRHFRAAPEHSYSFVRPHEEGEEVVDGKPVKQTFRPDILVMETFKKGNQKAPRVIGIYEFKAPEVIRADLIPFFWENEDEIPDDQDISLMEIEAEAAAEEEEEEEEEDEADEDDYDYGDDDDDSMYEDASDSSSDEDEEDTEDFQNEVDKDSLIQNVNAPSVGRRLPTALSFMMQQGGAYCSVTELDIVLFGNDRYQVLFEFPELSRDPSVMARFDAPPGVMRVAISEKPEEFALNFLGTLLRGIEHIDG